MQTGGVRTTVICGDANVIVIGTILVLCVLRGSHETKSLTRGGTNTHLNEDIPVPVFIEDVGVKYLELDNLATAMLILANEIFIRIGLLWILVQKLHVRVSRRRIQVIVQLLDVLSVISLGSRDAKEPFLEHSILLVPQGKRKAQTLVVVADTRDAILSPPVRPRASVLVGKVCPSIAVPRVVFPNGCLKGP
jgi:hypothetical protein